MSASNITVGATNVSVWTTYLLKQVVPGLKAELVFADYAEPAQIPANSGHYVARWNVPTMRIGSTTSLTDGTSGSAASMVTLTGVDGTIADYGEWFQISDLAMESDPAFALDAYKDIVAYAGAGAIDTLVRDAGLGSTNFLHANDTTTQGAVLAATNQLIAQDLVVVGSFFRSNDAKGWDKLSGDFMLAIHPDVEVNLVTDISTTAVSWSEVNKHVPVGFEQLINNHRFVGRLNGVSVLRTTNLGTVTEDVAAWRCLALARYGVGWLGLGETGPKAPKIMMKEPMGTFDPLETYHTLGWKVRATARLLDSARALVVYSAE